MAPDLGSPSPGHGGRPSRRGHHDRTTLRTVALAFAAIAGLLAATGQAHGALQAQLRHVSGTAGSGAITIRIDDNTSPICTNATGSSLTSGDSFVCPSEPWTLPGSGVATRSVTIANDGTVTPTEASVAVSSCAPVMLANSTAHGSPMLVRDHIGSYAATGPLGGGHALVLTGSGYASGAVERSPATAVTFGVWFRTTSVAGGELIGFHPGSPVDGGHADRVLSIAADGTVRATVMGATSWAGWSTTESFNDGAWHFAAVAVEQPADLATASLFVDGVQRGTTAQFDVGAPLGDGYWAVGGSDDDATVHAAVSSSPRFDGSLSNAVVIPSTLGAVDVAALASAANQADFTARAAGFGATDHWPLDDDGAATYRGSLDFLSDPAARADPCSMLLASIGGVDGSSAFCEWSPASPSDPCDPLVEGAASPTVSDLVVATSTGATLPPTAAGGTTTLTTKITRSATYDPLAARGLHLLLPQTYSTRVTGTGWIDTFSWPTSVVII